MKKLTLVILLIGLFSFIGCNENEKPVLIVPSQAAPSAGDPAGKDPSPLLYDFDTLKLSVTRSENRIRFTLTSKYSGWAAVGIGSRTMNGATMFIGFVDKNGKVFFTEQLGRAHTHSDVAADKRIAEKYAVKEAGGIVTFEVECQAAKVIPAGAKEIQVIIAASTADSLSAPHANRRQVTVKLE